MFVHSVTIIVATVSCRCKVFNFFTFFLYLLIFKSLRFAKQHQTTPKNRPETCLFRLKLGCFGLVWICCQTQMRIITTGLSPPWRVCAWTLVWFFFFFFFFLWPMDSRLGFLWIDFGLLEILNQARWKPTDSEPANDDVKIPWTQCQSSVPVNVSYYITLTY